MNVKAACPSQHGLYQDTFADPCSVNIFSYCNNPSARIRTLYAREYKRRAGPAVILGTFYACVRSSVGRLCHGFGIPADSCVDIGIIDPRRTNADQDIAWSGHWNQNIIAQLQLIITAIAGQ